MMRSIRVCSGTEENLTDLDDEIYHESLALMFEGDTLIGQVRDSQPGANDV